MIYSTLYFLLTFRKLLNFECIFSLCGQINVIQRKAIKYEKFRKDWPYDKRLVELGISQSGEKKAKRRHESFRKYVEGCYQEARDPFSLVNESRTGSNELKLQLGSVS